MKKFSNISNSEVGKEPEVKIDENKQKVENFKHSILKLMDDFLSIRSYGSARPEIMIPTHIAGKEMFVEALQDFLTQQENKQIISLLESLKWDLRDWKAIDDKINEIQEQKRNLIDESRITQILEKWGSDDENLSLFVREYKNKLDNQQIVSKVKCLEQMIKREKNIEVQLKLELFKRELTQ